MIPQPEPNEGVPTAAEIDFFLVPYGLDKDDVVERIEIRNPENSEFQFLMLAIWRRPYDEISLLCMWPTKEKSLTSDMS